MPYLVTDNTARYCSRCRRELTDPASRECGVGPVCRAKDNHLYAKTIEANLSVASALVLGTHTEALPSEIQERWEGFRKTFLHRMEKAQKNNDDPTVVKLKGSDFRDSVRDLDYFLSYQTNKELRERFIKIVESLGYVGLAGVLSGKSSLSKAKVWFENGRVYLKGTGCTPGFRTMRKIPGIVTPRRRGDRTPYSAPASEVDSFIRAIQKHWPLYEADLDNIKSEAKEWVKNHPDEKVDDHSTEKDVAYITHRSDDFIVGFPWIKGENMYGMIKKLKEVPYNSRSYNPDNKSWTFKSNYLEHVKEALSTIFDEVIEKDSGDMTPGNLYNSKSSKYKKHSKKYRRPRRRYY